jgi:YHS domain-containing protein
MARVKDPVCGMMIEPSEAAASYDYQGETYYFCSADERETFAADPSRYLDREVPIQSAGAADSARDSKDPNDVPYEKHDPPITKKGIPAFRFGSAGSGGAEFEPGPERHDEK